MTTKNVTSSKSMIIFWNFNYFTSPPTLEDDSCGQIGEPRLPRRPPFSPPLSISSSPRPDETPSFPPPPRLTLPLPRLDSSVYSAIKTQPIKGNVFRCQMTEPELQGREFINRFDAGCRLKAPGFLKWRLRAEWVYRGSGPGTLMIHESLLQSPGSGVRAAALRQARMWRLVFHSYLLLWQKVMHHEKCFTS